jgi:transposase
MLTMDQVNFIRKLEEYKGLSLREIARVTGHDFRTVKKYIDKENWNNSVEAKKRKKSQLDEFKPLIDKWLTDDLNAKRKQRHTAKRIYTRLCDELESKFDLSYRTVCYYVAEKKKELYRDNRGFLPLDHPPGEAQADFGKADFIENGQHVSGFYLNLSFPYSNASYFQLSRGQNAECLLTGLKTIFEYMGAIPQKIWFDNLSAAVVSIQKEGKRKLTDSFQRFMLHYGFEAVFCNPNSGHEKGHVEGKVGYNRRNFLVPIPEFNNFDEYNMNLLKQADKDMDRLHYKKNVFISELYEEDKSKMIVLPAVPYDVLRLEKVRTDKYGKFKFDKKYTYSSSPACAESEIWVKATADSIIVLNEDYKIITTHKRLYGENLRESMDWYPYLSLMARRPAALKYTGFYNSLPQTLKEYFNQCEASVKSKALKLICKIIQESDFEIAVKAFEETFQNNIYDLDSIETTYYRISSNLPQFDKIALPDNITDSPSYHSDITQYDGLLRMGGNISEGSNRILL